MPVLQHAKAHWDENGGTGLTDIVNDQGWDTAFERRIGWHTTSAFAKYTTVQSFVKIEYEASVPVPEPATIWLLSIGLAGVSLWAPRRRRTMDAIRTLAGET